MVTRTTRRRKSRRKRKKEEVGRKGEWEWGKEQIVRRRRMEAQ